VGDLVFLGGQVSLTGEGAVIDPGNMQAQTVTAMENIEKVLAELGLGLENIVKINTFYVGSQGEKDLQENASVRARYYRGPGLRFLTSPTRTCSSKSTVLPWSELAPLIHPRVRYRRKGDGGIKFFSL
jgi:enamine deaminase RidA (YjgF/YER057c/UK114 family)